MKKSIFLFFAAILCAFSMNVQATDLKGGEVVLLQPSTNWKKDGARFAVYFFNDATSKNSWVSMKAVEGESGIYYAIAPSGTWQKLIFCRMNPANNTNDWGNKWNQSGNCTWKNDKSLLTVGSNSWDNFTGTWSVKKVTSEGKLAASSANVSENEAVTLTPSLTTNTAINTIQSTEYTINPATGASVSGNTFTATAAGTYTVTATIKYRLNGYASTSFESTATATTTITVASAAEPKHDVKVTWTDGTKELQSSQTLSVGESTGYPVEAPEFKDYTFSGWTLGSGVQSADENANPISITTKASGEYTLVANYDYIEPVIKTIYCKMEYSWWTQASAAISAFISGTYGESATSLGTLMTLAPLESNVWKIDIDVARYQKVKFIRVKSDGSEDWGARTGLVEIPTDDKNLYTITQSSEKWSGECSGTWGVYEAPATAPKRYITGTKELVGGEGWKANEIEMTYDNATSIYSHTFTGLATGVSYALKVTTGGWNSGDTNWGYDAVKNPAEGVVNSDGNVGFQLATAGDVTVTFDGAKITVSTTGTFYIPKTYEYYIAGDESMTGYNWNPSGLGIEDTDADGIYSHEFTNLAAGTYQFRITNGSWSNTWGWSDVENKEFAELSAGDDNNNIKLTLTAAKTVTVNYNKTTKKISLDGLTPLIKQNLKYTVTVPKGTTKCYLVGLGDWNNFREMTQDPGNNRIFTLTVNDVYITDEYKYSASKNWDNAEVDVNNNDTGNRKWSESDVVVKWKGIDLVPEALTYTVTVPAGTEECYIAGTMNNWEFAAMEKSTTTPNTFTIDIANANEAHEYKYACKKNWDYAEVNADGSSVSNRTYSANDVVAKWGYPTYTVAGDNRIVFGEEWKETLTDNDMVDQGDGTYKWTKSKIALKKNTEIKFQVVKNHSWENKWPNDPWVINTISKDGYYTITIIFKESDQSITATANWTGEAPFKDFSNQPATLYFHPSFHWTSDNAEFAAYFYNEGFGADAEPTWADMTDSDGDGVYEVANAKQHEYVIICRMNPDRTENKWDDAVSWNKIETGITIPNTAGDLNTCIAFWKNCQGDVPTSECTWVAPTPLTDKNWSAFVSAYAGKTINAVIERSFKSGQYHTLCLPFDIPTNWLGEGTKAYQLTSIVANNTGDKLSLNATLWNTIVAGQPYIIVPVKGSEYEHVIINNVTVKNASAGTNVASGDGYKATLKAVTATGGKTNGSTEYYVGANDGKLYNAETNKLGLRAIIELTTTTGQPLPAKVRAYVAAGENVETGVEDIITTDAPVKVIENGQLIIIRDGVKYNVQGQLVK